MWEIWVLTGFQTTLFDLFQDNHVLSPISTDLWSQRLVANQIPKSWVCWMNNSKYQAWWHLPSCTFKPALKFPTLIQMSASTLKFRLDISWSDLCFLGKEHWSTVDIAAVVIAWPLPSPIKRTADDLRHCSSSQRKRHSYLQPLPQSHPQCRICTILRLLNKNTTTHRRC